MNIREEVLNSIKRFLEEEFQRYQSTLENSSLTNLESRYEDFINNLNTLMNVIESVINEYRLQAHSILSKVFYEKILDKPLHEIIDLAFNIGVLQDITNFLSREKIIRELDDLDHKRLYKLFKAIDNRELKDLIFKKLLMRIHEIPCSEILGYKGYFIELFGHPLSGRRELEYSTKLLREYINFIPIKCDSETVLSFLYNINRLNEIRAFDEELYNRLVDAIVDFFIKTNLHELSKLFEYKPYNKLLEHLDYEQLCKLLIDGLLNKIIYEPTKIKYAKLLYFIPKLTYYIAPEEILNKLCTKVKEVYERALTKLNFTNDFIEYIELYVGLRESMLTYWLKEYCKTSVKEPSIILSEYELKTMLKNSIEQGKSYNELYQAIELLKNIDKELSKKLRRSLKYYKRKYNIQ